MSYQIVAGGYECVECGLPHNKNVPVCPGSVCVRCGGELLRRLYQREVKPTKDEPGTLAELVQQMIGSLDELGRDHFARADAILVAKEYRRLARKLGVNVCD